MPLLSAGYHRLGPPHDAPSSDAAVGAAVTKMMSAAQLVMALTLLAGVGVSIGCAAELRTFA